MEHAIPPRYRKLSPIGYWVSWGCVAFNAVLALYLHLNPFKLIDSPFKWLQFWPVVFLSLAVSLACVLLKNNMKGVRAVMIVSVAVKAFWAWTLVLLALKIGFSKNLYLLDLWFFAAIVQSVVAIFTPPRIDYELIRQ